ncbi:hypothetical protein GIB67_002433 [Kingdonia uniflora]|uniref:Glutaredoxin domain-containing protein n=1 Tax=Kingdonia uniflora TaxID=39325 RepID=A0A7J7KYF8_9MAGN|nr:hypothetical protein GIB67_002433 [Kingdonia uniflora]
MAGQDEFNNNNHLKSLIFNRSISFHPSPQSPKKQQPNLEGSFKKSTVDTTNLIIGKVKTLCNSFEAKASKKESNFTSSLKRAVSSRQLGSKTWVSLLYRNRLRLPDTEDRIVVYFTSLRGVRRTYEDCCAVLMILRGFRVWVDERDISMDSAYKKELLGVLGEKSVSLPQVFIRGKYVGGAEEIKQLHEGGELAKLLKGFPIKNVRLVCESCGDARFVLCSNCDGSRKIFTEEEEQMRRCLECNENGLTRCPKCCC